jgi:two-component system sensor histidine kinase KdpD
MRSRRRQLGGFIAALAGLPLLTVALRAGSGLPLTDDILLFLAAVVGVALLGGRWPAVLAAVEAFLLLNYFFTPPLHTLTIATGANLVALAVFVVVALAVSWVVDLAGRRTLQADRAAADARTLATVAGSVLRGADPLDALLHQLRDTFALSSVTLLERSGAGWRVAASVGTPVASGPHDSAAGSPPPAEGETGRSRGTLRPGEGETGRSPEARPSGEGETGRSPAARPPGEGETVAADEGLVLVLRGPQISPSERRIVRAFAAQAAVALRQQRLAAAAEGDRVRTALLAAVSHDLRTPLASAKAAVAGLRSPEVSDHEDRAELLATAEESLDRLTALVANLLDMSRLQAGALGMTPINVGLEDVVPRALDELGPAGRRVKVCLPDDLAAVRADPGLLDRVLVNVVGNALRYSPPDRPPVIEGCSAKARQVVLRVIDYGPGIPAGDRERVFQAFQRLGDRDNHTGVGLGLALSRGLTEAMDGTLTPEDTPGGGLTMVIALPEAT